MVPLGGAPPYSEREGMASGARPAGAGIVPAGPVRVR
jgi:hypothetical protein